MRTYLTTLLLSIIFFTSLLVNAGQVSKEQARTVAKNLFAERTHNTAANINISNEFITQENNTPLYYIFNIEENKGFVMVAAQDNVEPILGYSTEGVYDENAPKPANFLYFMDYLTLQIKDAIDNNLPTTQKITSTWKKYLTGGNSLAENITSVSPLISTNWDQGCYYNAQCPYDASAYQSCQHVWVGCVATAMAQIMKYHAYPTTGTGQHSYNDPTYGTITANFGVTTYNWSAMPNQVYSSNSAVATISFQCGVSVDMQYGVDGSGAYIEDVPNAMQTYFSYPSSVEHLEKSWYTTANWESLLRTELDNSRPVLYGGYSASSGGHAFVCDGYQGTNYFHFNWGWSGSYNGYFYLSNLNPGGANFNQQQDAVIGIEPPSTTAPTADFSANATNINAGGFVNFTDSSTDNPTSWQWTFEGGTPATSTLQNPTNIIYDTPGNYDVTLVATNQYGTDTEVKTDYITVGGMLPNTDFTSDSTEIHMGSAVSYTDLSTNNPTSWNWTFEGGTPATSTEQNPSSITYNTPGNYNVTLVSTNQYGSNTETKTNYIKVLSNLNAEFTASETIIPTNHNINFTDLSAGNPTSWLWTFYGHYPLNSTEQNPANISYSMPGTYKVSLKVTDQWGDDTETKDAYITVYTPVVANFSASTNWLMQGESVDFTDNSTGNPISWAWDFEGGTPSTSSEQNPASISYNDYGVFPVSLTVANEYGTDVETKEGFIEVSGVGINIIEGKKIMVYPNPSNGNVNVAFTKDFSSNTRITISNSLGEIVKTIVPSSGNITINLTGEKAGMYYLSIFNNNEVIKEKVLLIK